MGSSRRQQEIRAMRGHMWSPGRPSTTGREDRVRFWQAIARGLSTEEAALEAGVSIPVGSRWFRQAGGMPPIKLVPTSRRYLSFREREEIAILNAQQLGVREIGRRIGRSPSTVSRELRRNASTRSRTVTYRATTAQWHAERRASRPKVSQLAGNDALRNYVQDRLAGAIMRPDGEPVKGPEVRFIGRRHGRRQDRRWAKSGAQSRSQTASKSTSLMMSPCASPMRRSTRPSTCKVEVPSGASSSRACEQGEPCASLEHERAGVAMASSRPRS